MKKLLALVLAGLMMLSLAACGTNDNPSSDEDNPGKNDSGLELAEITVDNWAQVVKDNFGVDLTDLALPDGWTCKDVEYGASVKYAGIYFEMDYTHEELTSDTEAFAFASAIFDELKSVATGDIKTSYGSGYTSFSEIELVADMIPNIQVPVGDEELLVNIKIEGTEFFIGF